MSQHADYWYRHNEDPDRSVRTSCQMMSNSPVLSTIADLVTGGYIVQRVDVFELCDTCGGSGRIQKKRPAFAWKTCPTCKGTPETNRRTL